MERKTTNDEIEVRCAVTDLRIEQRDGGTGRTVAGYAAVFDRWSEPICGWFRERIERGAFEGCDLSDVIMCFNHDPAALLARTTSGTLRLEVDGQGLRFEFDAPGTTLGNDMLELVRRGDVSKCSFSFTVAEDGWVYADAENSLEYDERSILKIARLYDTSLVVYPAYKDTEASVRALEARRAEQRRQAEREPAADAGQGGGPETDPAAGTKPGADAEAKRDAGEDPAAGTSPAAGAAAGTDPKAGAASRLREREVQFYQLKK